MKRIFLLLLLTLPFTMKAQTTILKADTVSAWIGNTQLPINSFYASWSDSAVSFIKLDGTPILANKKYNLWTDVNGTPFTSLSSLKAWVKQYFFVDASNALGGGGLIGKGGHTLMTADGTTTIFNITTNAGYIPSFFSLSATTPITQNQLNRTVTFPDNNTMRITFQNAPLLGENTDYVWVIYK